MSVPTSGLLFIPITLFFFFLYSRRLLHWTFFAAVFGAAAVVNIGGGFPVGITPYFFACMLFACRWVPDWFAGRLRWHPDDPIRKHLRLLWLFAVWSAFSAFALPVIFRGMPIDQARLGPDLGYYFQMPLAWTMSNAGQAAYIILDFIIVAGLARTTESRTLAGLVDAFSWSGAFVALFGVYQIIAHRMGLPFPPSVFNSNIAWGQHPDQSLAGDFRISSTFVEPSSAGEFLSAWCVFELYMAVFSERSDYRHWLFLALGSWVLVLTRATTGYVASGVIWAFFLTASAKDLLVRRKLESRWIMAFAMLILGLIVGLAHGNGAQDLLDAVLFDKASSTSGVHRVATFSRAVGVFVNSYGIGVGLGSNRAMSMALYILSNLGIPGIALFCCLLSQVYRMTASSRLKPLDRSFLASLTAVQAAFAATLIAMILSGAEITGPQLWLLWGLLLAMVRREWLLERAYNLSKVMLLEPADELIVLEERWAESA